jgi:hypothetical protein
MAVDLRKQHGGMNLTYVMQRLSARYGQDLLDVGLTSVAAILKW